MHCAIRFVRYVEFIFNGVWFDGLKHRLTTVVRYLSICFSSPITGLERPRGFQEVEAPRFQNNRHAKVVRLSALRTDRLYPQEMFLEFVFATSWVADQHKWLWISVLPGSSGSWLIRDHAVYWGGSEFDFRSMDRILWLKPSWVYSALQDEFWINIQYGRFIFFDVASSSSSAIMHVALYSLFKW
jgi:hypothetical protein